MRRHHLALVAIFIALSASAWAATTIGPRDLRRDAVRARHVKAGAIGTADVANDQTSRALTGKNVAADSLTGDDLGAGAVASSEVANESLGAQDLGAAAVGGDEVADGSLTGADIALDDFTEVVLGGVNSDCQPGGVTTNWVNIATFDDSTRSTLGFYRDPLGRVHLKGSIRCLSGLNSAESIFTLPPGFRPALSEEFATVAGSPRVLNSIVITSAGVVSPGAVTGTGAFLSLNGISFRCAPAGALGCP